MVVPEIIPAIMAATDEEYGRKLKAVESLVVRAQVVIADGDFVKATTIGASTVENFGSEISLDVHLMVKDPIAHIGEFSRIGIDRIIFHAEASPEMETVIEEIKSLGHRVGVALSLETPVSLIEKVIEGVDLVQLMAVEVGISGGKFNPAVLPKALSLRERYPDLQIAVAGGISTDNAKLVVDAGANELVIGDHLFGSSDIKSYVGELQTILRDEEMRLVS
jgi:ribulose-phosphate 3-epimerase